MSVVLYFALLLIETVKIKAIEVERYYLRDFIRVPDGNFTTLRFLSS